MQPGVARASSVTVFIVPRRQEIQCALLTAKRDTAAAQRYLERAINLHGLPEKITIDKSGASTTAIHSVDQDAWLDIELCQCKYLNNLVELDHRVVKQVMAPMPGFKSFWSARSGVSSGWVARRNRDHASGREGAVARPRWTSYACS